MKKYLKSPTYLFFSAAVLVGLALGYFTDFSNLDTFRSYGDSETHSKSDGVSAMKVSWAQLRQVDETSKSSNTSKNLDFLGKKVRLAGFIVPLGGDLEQLKEFMLIPNMVMCSHVPPPPPSNTIYVKVDNPLSLKHTFSPFEVFGTLTLAERKIDETAKSGYEMVASKILPYEEDDENEESELSWFEPEDIVN